MSRKLLLALACLAPLAPVVAGDPPGKDAKEPKNVVAAAKADGSFKTFLSLCDKGDVTKTLETAGQITVFAPTDAVMAKIPKADLLALQKDQKTLRNWLLNHLTGGKHSTSEFTSGRMMKSMRMLELFFDRDDGITINKVKIVKQDIAAQNGLVHGIDGILVKIEKQPREEGPAPKEAKEVESLYDLSVNTLEGKAASLADYKGKVVLVVNVASECGYTPQYAGLQKLHAELKEKGFAVLGFPSNEFGGQEPGDAAAIRKFCDTKYKVTFPIFEKCTTKPGQTQSPVYEFLTRNNREAPSWNFCKYLVGKGGKVIDFYKSDVKPDNADLRKKIDEALK